MFTNGWVNNRLFYKSWYTTGVVFSTNVSVPALVFNSRIGLQINITKNINVVIPKLVIKGNVSFLRGISKDIKVIQNPLEIQGYIVVQKINNIIIENDTNTECKFRDNNIDFY